MKHKKIKLNSLHKALGPQLITIYMIIVCIMLLSSATYAFWTQMAATESDIVLEADSVTYLTSFLSPENAEDLLTPPIAEKDSLKNNNITIETTANIVERLVDFRLLGKTPCNLTIDYQIFYLDDQDNFLPLPAGVIDVVVSYAPDALEPQNATLLAFDEQKNGYYIASFPCNITARLTLGISIAIVDELLDPKYKGREIKIELAFAAEKIEGGQG